MWLLWDDDVCGCYGMVMCVVAMGADVCGCYGLLMCVVVIGC